MLFGSRHLHTHIYKQTMNRTKHTWKNNTLFWIVINLMFDFDRGISLFMFSMWITISCYLDSGHVSVEFRCIHTCMSLQTFLDWRTRVVLRTGRRWMYEFEICVYFFVDAFDRQRRKPTHPTLTHVNRQTENKCARGRPRLLHTVLKCCFLWSFVTCHERTTAWIFHVGEVNTTAWVTWVLPFFLFWVWIHTASAPITEGTHTDGEA